MIRTARAILRKDLLIELRTKESVPAMVLFSITVYVLFHFGLDRDSLDGELASGVLWVTMLLAAVIGVTRLFAAEREQGGIDGLLLAPVDRTSLFVAKAAALFLFLTAVELVAVPAFALLLLGPGLGGAFPELLAILALANLGVAAVGALVAALAAETRARELIVPLLLLPLLVPLLIACAQATEPLMRQDAGPEDLGRWLSAPHSLRCGVRASLRSGLRLPPRGLMYSKGLAPIAAAAAVTITTALALVFFYAPNDADQGFIQKIFYIHVPMAIVALCGFVAGGIFAIRHLRSGDRSWDMRSYVAIHLSIILGLAVLITGSIWAKASWGHWWLWDEPVLVSFLVVFLLYCVYYPLRFSIEDPDRQARYSSVFAITAGAFVPLNFIAVRLAEKFTHPRVLSQTGGSMPGEMRLTFLVSLLGMALLFVALWKLELTAKHASMQLKRLRNRARVAA